MIELWLMISVSLTLIILFTTFRAASIRVEREVMQKRASKPLLPTKQPPIFLSTIPATMRQKLVALGAVLAMLAAFAAIVPFAQQNLSAIPAFAPILDALLCVMFFIIGYILMGQFLRLRSWSLLVISSGFSFQCLMAVIHASNYPGLFVDAPLQPGDQTNGWISFIWRAGFPLFLMTYAYLHGRGPSQRLRYPTIATVMAMGGVMLLAIGTSTMIINWNDYLPVIINDFRFIWYIGPTILLADIIALLLLWLRGDSVLDIWLMVATSASILDVILATMITGTERFDLGYYTARGYGLLAAGLVLCAMLDEMNRLYSSLSALMDSQQAASDAKYGAILDTVIDAVIVIDPNGIVQSCNKGITNIFQYDPSEVVGNNIKMLMPEPYNAEHDNYLSTYRQTKVRKIIGIGREVQGRRKDGGAVSLDLAVAEWHSGEEQLFTGILRDITERKQIERQLIQSQKMEAIGQLTGGMAHDFNNILGVVIGNLDMLSEHFGKGSNQQLPPELTDAIEASVAGADLVQRLLAFARRQPLQPRIIHIDEIVESVLPLIRRIIGAQIEIDTNNDEKPKPILADPAQFENALLNLIINSRDAMPDGGKLTIECRNYTMDAESAILYDVPVGRYSTLVVTDTGKGIPADILSRVFEPFFTTKSPGTGSGLGLSMVFGYAKQSGGVVRIYSEVGVGTSVRMYLPSKCEEGAEPEEEETEGLNLFHGNERILVVEDTTGARIVAQKILVSLGYTVRIAQDATEAMRFLDSGEVFDMLFTDIIMPGAMNGIGLARIVHSRFPRTKILFTSGFSTAQSADVANLHATYIVKPYRKTDLAKLLRAIFDNHRNQNGKAV